MKANKRKLITDPQIAGYHYCNDRSSYQTFTDGRAELYLYDDREHHRSRDP